MIAVPTIARCRISRIQPVRWSAREGARNRMETGLHNQSTKLVGQKIFAARNRAPIILTALVVRIAHLNIRFILVEVTTESSLITNRWLGGERTSPNSSAQPSTPGSSISGTVV